MRITCLPASIAATSWSTHVLGEAACPSARTTRASSSRVNALTILYVGPASRGSIARPVQTGQACTAQRPGGGGTRVVPRRST